MHVTCAAARSALVVAGTALVAAVAFAPMIGCGGAGPLSVRKILVDVEPAATGIDREAVRDVVEGVVKKARGIKVVDAGRGDAAVLRVRIEGYGPAGGTDADSKASNKTTLALTVEVTAIAGETGGGGYRGHALASGNGVVDARTLVAQALRDALAQVLMTRNAADLDSNTLVAWLTDGDASDEQKRRAVRILGSRRERAAVETLSKVLMGGDKELGPIALAALTNIGDPGAVDAVIAYSDRQPAPVVKQCIEAVRSMASPRGRAWLFTLSTGHPDSDVQQQASAALAALEAQAPGGPAVAQTAR